MFINVYFYGLICPCKKRYFCWNTMITATNIILYHLNLILNALLSWVVMFYFMTGSFYLIKKKNVFRFSCSDCNFRLKWLGVWAGICKTVIFYVALVCLFSSPDGCLLSGLVHYAVVLRCWLLAGHKLCEKNLIHYATRCSQMLFCGVRNVLSFFRLHL